MKIRILALAFIIFSMAVIGAVQAQQSHTLESQIFITD